MHQEHELVYKLVSWRDGHMVCLSIRVIFIFFFILKMWFNYFGDGPLTIQVENIAGDIY